MTPLIRTRGFSAATRGAALAVLIANSASALCVTALAAGETVAEPLKPSAYYALERWWEPGDGVTFVGQAAAMPALVIVFADEVADPAAVAQGIKLIDDQGDAVEGTWEHGDSRKVLVHKNLDPGRYLVMIEGAGAPVYGAVFVERS